MKYCQFKKQISSHIFFTYAFFSEIRAINSLFNVNPFIYSCLTQIICTTIFSSKLNTFFPFFFLSLSFLNSCNFLFSSFKKGEKKFLEKGNSLITWHSCKRRNKKKTTGRREVTRENFLPFFYRLLTTQSWNCK